MLLRLFISQFCEKSQNCEIKSCNKLFHIIQWRKRAVSMLVKHLKKRNHSLLLIKLLFICIFVLVFNNNDKIKNSYINNYIVIILKKRIGGKYVTFHDFFFCNLQKTSTLFLSINSADSIAFKLIICAVIFCPMPTNHISFWRYFNGECENKNT